MTPALAALLDAVNTAVTRLRSVELSEGCNTCEGLDADAVHRVADDLEHAARVAASATEKETRP